MDRVVQDFEELARADLDYFREIEDPEDWELDGFMLPSYSLAFDLFRVWRKHGIMPVSGGYLDQPSQWIHDMKKMERLYATKSAEVGIDVRRKRDQELEKAKKNA